MHAVLMRVAGVTFLALMTYSMSVGPASAAPSVTGQSYADASSALSSAGLTATVATTVGDQLPRDKCLVVNQHNESVAQKRQPFDCGQDGRTITELLQPGSLGHQARVLGWQSGGPSGQSRRSRV